MIMSNRLVRLGDFSFRYRGYLLPIAVMLLLVPSPRLFPNPAYVGVAGSLIALIGQAMRVGTIGLAYIIRGGKDHRVYAEDLVTSGLYSHVRNPMYVANFFLMLGLALASNSWVFALVGVPLATLMHRSIVAAEEHFLRSKFGPQYDAYCARVPRWIPKLKGLGTTVRSMQFNWRRVLEKEYASPFDWMAAIAVIIILNIWRTGRLEDHSGLVVLMALIVLARLVVWAKARGVRQASAERPV